MAHWTKPSGMEVETNDEKLTIEHCEAIGWLRANVPGTLDPPAAPETEVVHEDTPETAAEEPMALPDPLPTPRKRGRPRADGT